MGQPPGRAAVEGVRGGARQIRPHCCDIWTESGFGDTCALTITAGLREAGVDPVRTQPELAASGALPPWLDDEAVHRSHQSALLRKDEEHYRPLFPEIPADLPYVWPVRSEAVLAAERRRAENPKTASRAQERTGRGRAAAPQAEPGREEGRVTRRQGAAGPTSIRAEQAGGVAVLAGDVVSIQAVEDLVQAGCERLRLT